MTRSRITLSVTIAALGTLGCHGDNPRPRTDRTANEMKRIEIPERKLASRPDDIPEILPPPTEVQLRGLRGGVEMVESADADMRFVRALTAVMIASKGRIPKQLADDLVAYNGAPSRKRSRTLSEAFENSAWMFDEICGRSFDSVFAEAVSIGRRGEMARYVWKECQFERFALLDGEEQYVEISGRTGPEPLLAYFVFAYLEQHGGAQPLEKQLLREVALGMPEGVPEPIDVEAWLRSH